MYCPLCRDVLGNLLRIYFGKKKKKDRICLDETSVSPHKYINAGTEKKDKIIGLPATTIGRCIGPLYGLQRKTGF